MLSYATDYTTDAIVVRRPVQIGVANVRRNRTENQRLARTRLNLRYPSIVFNAAYRKDILSTEQGVGRQQQQDQELAFFNRNRLFIDQVCINLPWFCLNYRNCPNLGMIHCARLLIKCSFFNEYRSSNQDATIITAFATRVDPLRPTSMRLASFVYHTKRQAAVAFRSVPIQVPLVMIVPFEQCNITNTICRRT